MKATINNYHKLISEHGAPADLKEIHNTFIRDASENNWEAYKKDEVIKNAVDTYFQAYDNYLEGKSEDKPKEKPKAEPKPKKQQKPKPEPKPKPKPKEPKKGPEPKEHLGRKVGKLRGDIYLIKRFTEIVNREVLFEVASGLLLTLQKCFTDKRVTKKSRYASEVEGIQKTLIQVCNNSGPGKKIEIQVPAAELQALKTIASNQRVYPSMRLIKDYLNLQGQEINHAVARELHDKISHALAVKSEVSPKDPLRARLEEVQGNLAKYLDRKGDFTITYGDAHLRGLQGLTGLHEPVSKLSKTKGGVISSVDFMKEKYETIGLTGKYKTFLGDLHKGFAIIVYGLPGQGKTTFCLCFAKHLAQHNGKVLFASNEEYGSKTLQDKLVFAGGAHPNLHFSETLDGVNLNAFDFLFIDSIQRLGMSLQAFKALCKKHPHLGIVLVGQVNKKGQMKGAQEWEHEVGATVVVSATKAVTTKNRYNALGEMKVR